MISKIHKVGAWAPFSIAFFYALGVGLLLQLIIVPYFLHWAEGYEAPGLIILDAISFHRLALEMLAEMQVDGWDSWVFSPSGNPPIGIAAALYYITGLAKPWVIMPLNAVLHGVSAALLYSIVRMVGFGNRTALVATLPFIFFPSAMSWFTQLHKDGFFIFANLLFIYGWVLLFGKVDRSELFGKGALAVFSIVGGVLAMGASRGYATEMVLLFLMIFVVVFVLYGLIRNRGFMAWYLLVAVAIFMGGKWAVKVVGAMPGAAKPGDWAMVSVQPVQQASVQQTPTQQAPVQQASVHGNMNSAQGDTARPSATATRLGKVTGAANDVPVPTVEVVVAAAESPDRDNTITVREKVEGGLGSTHESTEMQSRLVPAPPEPEETAASSEKVVLAVVEDRDTPPVEQVQRSDAEVVVPAIVSRKVNEPSELPQVERILKTKKLEPAMAKPSTPSPRISQNIWRKTAWIPESIDWKLKRIRRVRYNYVTCCRGAGSNVDVDVDFNSAVDVIGYIPRAAVIGFLSPFPSQWMQEGRTTMNTMMRRVSALEMALVYLFLSGWLLAVAKWWRSMPFWVASTYGAGMVVIFSTGMINIGTLYRIRYGFLMVFIAFGVAALYDLISRKDKGQSRAYVSAQ